MNTPTIASGAQFRICPLCEEGRLVISGLNEARCSMCAHEPDEDFLKTIRQMFALPDTLEIPRSHSSRNHEPENQTWERG